MINRSQLKFHESFQPEEGYIAKILELASGNYRGNKFEISEKTGIPTGRQKGKVEPHIRYASYMGLISFVCEKGNYTLHLTSLGNRIYVEDPYLHENLSKWLCHYNISRKGKGAPQWDFFVNEANVGFVKSIAPEQLMLQISERIQGNVSFEEIFGVMKRSYVDGFFSTIGYISIDEDTGCFRFNEIPYRDYLLFAYGYAIISGWDTVFPKKKEITLIELNDELSFNKVFGLNDDSVNEVLEELEYENILRVNRQLFPATIIRTSGVEDLILRLYSRLL